MLCTFFLSSADFLSKLTFLVKIRKIIRISSSLDPDQVQQTAGPNCLNRLSAYNTGRSS